MSAYPFGQPFHDQLANLEHGLSLLRAFHERHPALSVWAASPIGPTVFLGSDEIFKAGSLLGREGWQTEAHHIWKECMGVRVECRLPSTVHREAFNWEGVQA